MPGIVGIIGAGNPKENASVHQQMLGCLLHEPFYVSGNYINEPLGLNLGWVAHERSFSDCNPIWNETKDICLIFSGEDFTDNAEIDQLKAKGHTFAPNNASYLVHWYEELGLDFIATMNGCFSGVLVDLRKQSVVLFNDRYGLNRIYCHEHEGRLYFSSEAKSILKVFPGLRRLDPKGVAEVFSCGCVLQDRTLYPEISLLPSGSRWEFKAGMIDKNRYFKPETWESRPILSTTEFYDQLKATFAKLLPRYLKGTNPVAMSLTGGLDGRMMMAWANSLPETLPCYTFGGSYRDCSDVKIARQVAKACQQTHKTIEVGRDFFAQFPTLAEKSVYLSDGTMDVIGAVELYANKIARQIAPVRLTGNYGSEIVRGNVAFKASLRHESALEPEFASLVKAAVETYNTERQCHWLTFIAFKQVPWHHYSRLSVEQSQLTLRSPYLDNDLIALMYQAPSYDYVLAKEPSLRLIMEGNADLAKIPTDRGLVYPPQPLLGKLRHQYDEFTVKAEYAYDYGMPQWLAKIDHALAPLHFERLFLGRHKFYHFRVWYRDQLADYVKSVLLDQKTLQRSYFRQSVLKEMVNAHTTGNRNYTLELHRALSLELLQRQLEQM